MSFLSSVLKWFSFKLHNSEINYYRNFSDDIDEEERDLILHIIDNNVIVGLWSSDINSEVYDSDGNPYRAIINKDDWFKKPTQITLNNVIDFNKFQENPEAITHMVFWYGKDSHKQYIMPISNGPVVCEEGQHLRLNKGQVEFSFKRA